MAIIRIDVPDEQRKTFIDLFKTREQQVLQSINSMEAELLVIRENLSKLQNGEVNGSTVETKRPPLGNHPVNGEYQKSWTQPQKVIYLLKKIGRPAGSGELADLLIKDYETNMERPKAVAAISAVLTGKTTRKLFARSLNERNQFVYGLVNNK